MVSPKLLVKKKEVFFSRFDISWRGQRPLDVLFKCDQRSLNSQSYLHPLFYYLLLMCILLFRRKFQIMGNRSTLVLFSWVCIKRTWYIQIAPRKEPLIHDDGIHARIHNGRSRGPQRDLVFLWNQASHSGRSGFLLA